MSKITSEAEYEEAVKSYKEQPYHQEGEVFVYDTPVECYYEVWQEHHEGYSMLAKMSSDIYEDAIILAFSKNSKALEQYRGSNIWVLVEPDIEDDNFGRFVDYDN